MKLFLNILLGLGSAACAVMIVLQGFLFPDLAPWIDLLLRLSCAVLAQILALRLTRKPLLRYLPAIVSAAAAVWGLFLLLTSPSWRGATVSGFLHDYAGFFGGCFMICIIYWIRHWLKGIYKAIRKELRRRRKRRKMKDIPHS